MVNIGLDVRLGQRFCGIEIESPGRRLLGIEIERLGQRLMDVEIMAWLRAYEY